MKLLLDTHILLWAAQGSEQLSSKAKALIEGPKANSTLAPQACGKSPLKTNLAAPILKWI